MITFRGLARRGFTVTLVFLAVAACANQGATSRSTPMPFDTAVTTASDDLVSQTRKFSPLFAPIETAIPKGTIVVDPVLDGVTGQQTVVSQAVEDRVRDRITSQYPQFQVRPMDGANLDKAQYVLTGTISREPGGNGAGVFKINLALTDLKSGQVIAQASSRSLGSGLDTNPTPYYRDSPVITRDGIVSGYIETSKASPGVRANAAYIEGVPVSAALNNALAAYNSGQYEDALTLYEEAAKLPDGQQLRVYSGIYLTNWQLGRSADAERAFAQLVTLALASNSLDIKFLFRPNSTEFWSDPRISGPYPMWLRQIARQVADNGMCMNLIGHTSRTGTEQYNERLSQQRAEYIKSRLNGEAPQLGSRLTATGVGFHENIVGTGTDDLRDALDRRVEFRVTNCANTS